MEATDYFALIRYGNFGILIPRQSIDSIEPDDGYTGKVSRTPFDLDTALDTLFSTTIQHGTDSSADADSQEIIRTIIQLKTKFTDTIPVATSHTPEYIPVAINEGNVPCPLLHAHLSSLGLILQDIEDKMIRYRLDIDTFWRRYHDTDSCS